MTTVTTYTVDLTSDQIEQLLVLCFDKLTDGLFNSNAARAETLALATALNEALITPPRAYAKVQLMPKTNPRYDGKTEAEWSEVVKLAEKATKRGPVKAKAKAPHSRPKGAKVPYRPKPMRDYVTAIAETERSE